MFETNELDDIKDEYFASYGDLSNIYNEPMNFIDRQICELIVTDIKELEPNSIFTFSTYLNAYSIFDLKDKFKFTYESLLRLQNLVILPRAHCENCIALPFNIPYLKIK